MANIKQQMKRTRDSDVVEGQERESDDAGRGKRPTVAGVVSFQERPKCVAPRLRKQQMEQMGDREEDRGKIGESDATQVAGTVGFPPVRLNVLP